MSIFIVLPAYNEQESIIPLFTRLNHCQKSLDVSLNVVLVDDGSIDETEDVALQTAKDQGLSLEVVNHRGNQGLGKAIETGITHFLTIASENDVLITMDCDDTQPPELIGEMYSHIVSGNYDLVIASRYQKGSRVVGLSNFRLLMSYGSSFLLRLLFPIKNVRDYTCGYRAYSYEFLQKLVNIYSDELFKQRGFACMVDILLKTRVLNPRVKEVAMILRYDQKQGDSKMKVFKTVYQTLKLIVINLIGNKKNIIKNFDQK